MTYITIQQDRGHDERTQHPASEVTKSGAPVPWLMKTQVHLFSWRVSNRSGWHPGLCEPRPGAHMDATGPGDPDT